MLPEGARYVELTINFKLPNLIKTDVEISFDKSGTKEATMFG